MTDEPLRLALLIGTSARLTDQIQESAATQTGLHVPDASPEFASTFLDPARRDVDAAGLRDVVRDWSSAALPLVCDARLSGSALDGGRAGMAALIVDNADGFDGRAFFEHCSARLASYAQPVFLRLSRQADMTSTFKLRKVDLQRDGYDPADAKDDPLLVRDDAQKSFVLLNDDSLAAAGYPPFEAERDS